MSRSFGPVEISRTCNSIFATDRAYQSASILLHEGRSEGHDEFFDPPLESKYECPICLLGLREPVQTSCGHRFCKGCIKRSIRDAGPKCPIDNEPLSESQLYPDNFAKREMMNFTVACRLKKTHGCDWKGLLCDIEEHSEVCPYADVVCPNKCGETLQRKNFELHDKEKCPKRKVSCKFCQGRVAHTGYQDHLRECLKVPVECDHCSTSIPRDEISDHEKRYCPNVETTCPNKGCSFKGLRQAVKEHYTAHLVDHIFDLAITVRELIDGKSEKLASTSKGFQASEGPQEQQSADVGIQQSVSELRRSYQTVQHEADELRRMTNEHSTFVTVLERRQEETRVRHDRHIQEITHRQTRHETRLIEYEGRVCNGTFIWRIDNFRQCRQDAISGTQTAIHSPAFFTNMYGHKMCMRINLNGVDSGVGKHISLFVHMMQGEWDEIIEWPFTGRIALSILDQGENVEFRHHIVETLIAKPNLLAFQRPTAPRNYKGYGYVEFAPIDALLDGQFVKNNVLLIKIQISH